MKELNLNNKETAELNYIIRSAILFSEVLMEDVPENLRDQAKIEKIKQVEKIKRIIKEKDNSIYAVQLIYYYLTAVMDLYHMYIKDAEKTDDEGKKFIAEKIRGELKPLETYINKMNDMMHEEEEE